MSNGSPNLAKNSRNSYIIHQIAVKMYNCENVQSYTGVGCYNYTSLSVDDDRKSSMQPITGCYGHISAYHAIVVISLLPRLYIIMVVYRIT